MSVAGGLVFWVCAGLSVLSACGTVFARAPMRAALSLLVHIASLAALYLTLSAHLLAAIQLIIYAGAVVVLFVFVIMVIGPTPEPASGAPRALVARVASGFLLSMVIVAMAGALGGLEPQRAPALGACPGGTDARCDPFGGVGGLAEQLYTQAVVPFELISVLLLVAVLGAIALAGKRRSSCVTEPHDATGTADAAADRGT